MTTPRYHTALPQLGRQLFLADGGVETTLRHSEQIGVTCGPLFPAAGPGGA